MMFRMLALAGLVGATLSPAAAQDLRGPREQPPAGFAGQQYVDSRGCMFLRGGIGGSVTWVPRVSRDRRQICGMTPSFTPETVAAAPPAPAPAPRRAVDPMETVATTTAAPRIRDTSGRSGIPAARYAAPVPVGIAAAPAAAAAPRASLTVPVAGPKTASASAPQVRLASATPGCPAHAPYGERLLTTDGRTALLCVRSPDGIPDFARRVGMSEGRVTAPAPPPPTEIVARASAAPASPVTVAPVATGAATFGPRYLADGRISCPASAPVAQRFPLRGGGSTILCTTGVGGIDGAVAGYAPSGQTFAPLEQPPVPKGYRPAWQDDRLNPRRGQMAASGQAAQDQVWTREVPARLVTDAAKVQRHVTVSASGAARPAVTLSTSAAPRAVAPAAAATGRFYVQVGSFGVPANADGARSRLDAMGLPVAMGRGSIKGKPVQVVHAGPFASAGQAQAALTAARRAGFSDAFIR